MALALFSVRLGWTPLCCAGPIGATPDEVTPAETLAHLALPLAVLTLFGTASIALHPPPAPRWRRRWRRIPRSSPSRKGPRAGTSPAGHAARAALLPALTLVCASTGEILGGNDLLAEQVFAYPGLGRATVDAGLKGDVPLLLALTSWPAALVASGNLLADRPSYARVDPRLRGGGGAK